MARIRQDLARNGWPVTVILACVAAGAVAGQVFGFRYAVSLYQLLWLQFTLLGLTVTLAAMLAVDLIRTRPAEPLRRVRQRLIDWRIPQRALAALPLIFLSPLFFSAFTSVKSAIPVMHPFDLDPLFVRWDRAIHGTDPWLILQPVLGHPLITSAINVFYNLWLFIFYGVLALTMVMVRRHHLRNQFLVAFFLCWAVLGLVAATGLASVGPCFFGDFYPGQENPFAAQMAYLRAAGQAAYVPALSIQADLLRAIQSDHPELGSGISAMPSLHVSIAVLMAIYAWKFSRLLGLAATLFALIIMVGSVHLAWHYAVDGYVSLAATPLIWLFSGWLVRRRPLAWMSARIGARPGGRPGASPAPVPVQGASRLEGAR